MREKSKLLRHASGNCLVLGHLMNLSPVIKPIGTFFTRKDGTIGLINRENIDSGAVKAAGIKVIDGDKLDEMEPEGHG